ncbi:hypothetical protein R1flu_024429 [Riccia fluitans]|uniref:Uncharacterized protein n=1 Tax=Riccia fluitans TaxID=41844 RepID=A0ABD1XUV8_9MARC
MFGQSPPESGPCATSSVGQNVVLQLNSDLTLDPGPQPVIALSRLGESPPPDPFSVGTAAPQNPRALWRCVQSRLGKAFTPVAFGSTLMMKPVGFGR